MMTSSGPNCQHRGLIHVLAPFSLEHLVLGEADVADLPHVVHHGHAVKAGVLGRLGHFRQLGPEPGRAGQVKSGTCSPSFIWPVYRLRAPFWPARLTPPRAAPTGPMATPQTRRALVLSADREAPLGWARRSPDRRPVERGTRGQRAAA